MKFELILLHKYAMNMTLRRRIWDGGVTENYMGTLTGWLLEDSATWEGFQLTLWGNLCPKQGENDCFLGVKNDCFLADF